MPYYRGGNNLTPRSIDVEVDAATGLLLPTKGVSIQSDPHGLKRFGDVYELSNIPPVLKALRRGGRKNHYELVPAVPMTIDEYESALRSVILTKVTT